MHISCSHQFQASSAKIHHSYLRWRMGIFINLVRGAKKSERSFGCSTDQLHGKFSLAQHLFQKSSAVTSLTNCFGSHNKYWTCIMFSRQRFVAFECSDGCFGLLLRDFTCSSDTLTNTHQFLLVLNNLQVIWCTASNDEMDSIAANIDGGTHGGRGLYLHSNYPAPLSYITKTGPISCSSTCHYPYSYFSASSIKRPGLKDIQEVTVIITRISTRVYNHARKDIDTPQKIKYHRPRAEVVKSVDTQRSGRCARKGMGVRVPPSALLVFRRPQRSTSVHFKLKMPHRCPLNSTKIRCCLPVLLSVLCELAIASMTIAFFRAFSFERFIHQWHAEMLLLSLLGRPFPTATMLPAACFRR